MVLGMANGGALVVEIGIFMKGEQRLLSILR
jgi:hypothetical protein